MVMTEEQPDASGRSAAESAVKRPESRGKQGCTQTVPAPRAGESRSARRRRVLRVVADKPVPKAPDRPPVSPVDTAPRAGGSAPDAAGLRRWRLLACVVLVVLVGALVAAGLAGRAWYDQSQLDGYRQQALAAARQTTVNFVSISAATVDADLRRIADGATGQFKDEFTGDMAQIRGAVLANKVDSRGTVLRAAVVSLNRRSAVVLVAVDATVKNTSAPDGRLSHYRIQVNLARDAHSGRWLVAQLQFVG
jgi:Mce-associated membrane protein